MTTIKPTSDVESVINILNLNDHYFGGADAENKQKSVEQGIIYGSFIDDKLVECIVFHHNNNYEVFEIVWLAILPEFQGQGIGSELLTTSFTYLPNTCKLVEVKTLSEIDPDPHYARTRNFYKKHGFISLETIHPYPGWGENDPCQIFIKIR